MKTIEIYTRPFCIWCLRAKLMLRMRGLSFVEHDASSDAARAEVVERTGRKTVPQVLIEGRLVGGSEELAALIRTGELETLLS